MVGLLQAIPGTKLHQRLQHQGRLRGPTSGNNSDGTTNFAPRMNSATLRDGYRHLVRHLYTPGPYYQRVRTFLREYRPARVPGVWNWRYPVAFAKASVRLGIFGRERFQYWGLLLWTSWHRPALVPLAVTLAIYGLLVRKSGSQ
jgi:hypothetical protein